MVTFLTWLAVFFFAAPFFLWGAVAFYLRTKKQVVHRFALKVFSLIMLGITLGTVVILVLVFCF